ncbi:Uncharacterised protein [Bartonella grahamii]|uniref:Uncharacterized protein n=1 Tax=Bartonella grahamii TaxID=33045 RepID=A0A336NAE9_BARGR|nr:Uncharacterised protein [Bartonella grahamii]
MREIKQVLFNADTLNKARGANIAQTTARHSFKAYTTSTFNTFSQIFFLLCSKTIIAAILIHQNAINLSLTQQYRKFYICSVYFGLFRLADFIFAYFVTSMPSTENNNALTRTLSIKRPPADKKPQHIKDLSSLKIQHFIDSSILPSISLWLSLHLNLHTFRHPIRWHPTKLVAPIQKDTPSPHAPSAHMQYFA